MEGLGSPLPKRTRNRKPAGAGFFLPGLTTFAASDHSINPISNKQGKPSRSHQRPRSSMDTARLEIGSRSKQIGW
jgi:hypothetical protein